MIENACVIVPVFNEAEVLGEVLAGLCLSFDEVICVDDGSTDASADIARACGATVLRHAVNLGQGAALQTGFDFVLHRTEFAHVVTFDADGQHFVDDALAMLARARESGVDLVLGSRSRGSTHGQPTIRRIVRHAGLRFSRWNTGLDLTDTHNGLRVLNRRALGSLRLRQRGMAHASELESLIAVLGLSWVEHPVSVAYSAYSQGKGQSNLNAFNIVYDLCAARLGTPT
jgi:glycosyltransferase involved in cell wall biosynthesis